MNPQKRDDDDRHNHNIFERLINTSEKKAHIKNNKNKLESDNDIHKKIFIHQERENNVIKNRILVAHCG